MIVVSDLSLKWVRLTPNETNPGLYQIRFQYIILTSWSGHRRLRFVLVGSDLIRSRICLILGQYDLVIGSKSGHPGISVFLLHLIEWHFNFMRFRFRNDVAFFKNCLSLQKYFVLISVTLFWNECNFVAKNKYCYKYFKVQFISFEKKYLYAFVFFNLIFKNTWNNTENKYIRFLILFKPNGMSDFIFSKIYPEDSYFPRITLSIW